ncbi:hypothetical protein NXT3_CH01962 [Sinorhizobium fredii]|uniref:Uncharacterized protein n=1 Tax=Rhizobium fredii TaxID=380 RepID=A0A2L0H4X8_RHIFR|nr:hypothetical protein NXT3_CH01962 [Sinorhizobium fredii]
MTLKGGRAYRDTAGGIARCSAIPRQANSATENQRLLEKFIFHGDPYSDGMWTFTSGRGSHGTRLYLCGPENATHVKRML